MELKGRLPNLERKPETYKLQDASDTTSSHVKPGNI